MRRSRPRPTGRSPRTTTAVARPRLWPRLPRLAARTITGRMVQVPLIPLQVFAAAAAIAARPAGSASLSNLLTSHVLRDGEVVLLIRKPSKWFIPLNSLRWLAVGFTLLVIAAGFAPQLHGLGRAAVEAAGFLIAGRLMWSTLQWMGRLYILTDQRILTLSGVFQVDVFDCPLRKVADARLLGYLPERTVGVGSIAVCPCDDDRPGTVWQTLADPADVHEQIVETIRRAKQRG